MNILLYLKIYIEPHLAVPSGGGGELEYEYQYHQTDGTITAQAKPHVACKK